MATEIKSKFGTSTAMTITLASLASSTAGVGRQSTLVDNSINKYQRVHIYFKVTTGTSPTANRTIAFYLLKSDTTLKTDGAGASDAGLTVVSADQVYGVATNGTSNVTYTGSFIIDNPGPEWGLAVVHDTVAALHATGGNHAVSYLGENPELQ